MHTDRLKRTGSSGGAEMRRRGQGLVILLGFLGCWQTCRAADFPCPADASGVACLIEAINMANGNGEANTITLEAGTYTLTAVDNDTDGRNGLPSITSPLPLTIQGAGAEFTIIQRDPSALSFRLFHVAATGVLTLHGLTLRRGTIDAADFSFRPLRGGGIWNLGTLTIRHSTLADNMAATNLDASSAAGGGIYNGDGKVTLEESTLDGNQTRAGFGSSGGGLYNGGGTVHLTRSTLMDNMALGGRGEAGGGLHNAGGTVTLTDSVLTGNATIGGRNSFGGGIANDDTLTVTNTLLTNNLSSASSGSGGGISNNGMLIITQSTFMSNHADNGNGGGLFSRGGSVHITTSTFADNTALGSSAVGGGGLSVSGTVSLTNTTVVHNSATRIEGFQTGGRGGGLEVTGGLVTLTNCTIAENVADSVRGIGAFHRSQGGGSTQELVAPCISRTRSSPAIGAWARWEA